MISFNVNNAGITRPVPHDDLDGLDDALIDDIFRVNFRGAFASVPLCSGVKVTKTMPCGKASSWRRATSKARRVLPMSPRPDQRQQAARRFFQQRRQIVDLGLPVDKRGRL